MSEDCPKNEGHISKAKIVCQTKQDLLEEKARKCAEQQAKSSIVEKSSKQLLWEATCSAFEKPDFLRIVGPKHLKIAQQFVPSLVYFTVAGALCTVYLCDWKDVLQYVPLWRGKYKTDD